MKKNLLIVLAALSAIIVEAQQLRDGHFFKTFTDAQQTALAAPEVFSQWLTIWVWSTSTIASMWVVSRWSMPS